MQCAYGPRVQMQGADLRGAEMQGANLYGAQMWGTNLPEAQMQGARLSKAQMHGANLLEAKMQGAYLPEAQMWGANLKEAHMQGANLYKAQMQGADLPGAKMQGAYLQGAQMQGADFKEKELDLRGANDGDYKNEAPGEHYMKLFRGKDTEIKEVIFSGGLSKGDIEEYCDKIEEIEKMHQEHIKHIDKHQKVRLGHELDRLPSVRKRLQDSDINAEPSCEIPKKATTGIWDEKEANETIKEYKEALKDGYALSPRL